jgi:hypothetical protein
MAGANHQICGINSKNHHHPMLSDALYRQPTDPVVVPVVGDHGRPKAPRRIDCETHQDQGLRNSV